MSHPRNPAAWLHVTLKKLRCGNNMMMGLGRADLASTNADKVNYIIIHGSTPTPLTSIWKLWLCVCFRSVCRVLSCFRPAQTKHVADQNFLVIHFSFYCLKWRLSVSVSCPLPGVNIHIHTSMFLVSSWVMIQAQVNHCGFVCKSRLLVIT